MIIFQGNNNARFCLDTCLCFNSTKVYLSDILLWYFVLPQNQTTMLGVFNRWEWCFLFKNFLKVESGTLVTLQICILSLSLLLWSCPWKKVVMDHNQDRLFFLYNTPCRNPFYYTVEPCLQEVIKMQLVLNDTIKVGKKHCSIVDTLVFWLGALHVWSKTNIKWISEDRC